MISFKNNFLAGTIVISLLSAVPAFARGGDEGHGQGEAQHGQPHEAQQHEQRAPEQHEAQQHEQRAPEQHEAQQQSAPAHQRQAGGGGGMRLQHQPQAHNVQQNAHHGGAQISQAQPHGGQPHGGNVGNNGGVNAVVNSGNWTHQRSIYRSHWNHISREEQRELDAQMRAEWLAYHHHHWNNAYSWNMYNDPGFMDYLHENDPGLLSTLLSYMGI